MKTKTLVSAGCAALFAALATHGEVKPFRVGFLVGEQFHSKEFTSIPLRATDGWTFRDFLVKADDSNRVAVFDALTKALEGELDMLVVNPLAPDYFVENGRAEAAKAFVERGGTLVIPCACYPVKFEWTTVFGPDYAPIGHAGYSGWLPSNLNRYSPEPPIRWFPSKQVDGGILWYHYSLDSAGKAWKPVVKCALHDHPCAVQAAYGKGSIYITSLRVPYFSFFENQRAAHELRRAGLEVVGSAHGLAFDRAQIDAAFEVKGGKAVSAELEFAADGKKCVLKAKGPKFVFKGVNEIHGDGTVRLVLKDAAGAEIATLVDRKQRFDAFIELDLPRYRGRVSTCRREADVKLGFRLNPGSEKVKTAGWKAKVTGPDGKTVWFQNGRLSAGKSAYPLAAKIPLKAPAGKYELSVEVASSYGSAGTASAAFEIVAPTPTQVIVDQDNVLLRGGKPWLPLGLYGGEPDVWPTAKEIGFDLQHSMNWNDASFPKLAELGQGLLYENKHRWPENLAKWAGKLKDEKYAAINYVVDEPDDTEVWKWEACREAMAKADPEHPTYAVVLFPTSFAYQKEIADILAVDEYPILKDGSGDVGKVAWRIDTLKEAIGDDRPIVSVVQAFGFEPMPEFEVMPYLSLVHGAKGLLWYSWDWKEDGLGKSTAHQNEMKRILADIRKLAPAILAPGAEQLKLGNGAVHALACGDKSTGRKLICVNPTKAEATVTEKVKGFKTPFKVPAMSVVVK